MGTGLGQARCQWLGWDLAFDALDICYIFWLRTYCNINCVVQDLVLKIQQCHFVFKLLFSI